MSPDLTFILALRLRWRSRRLRRHGSWSRSARARCRRAGRDAADLGGPGLCLPGARSRRRIHRAMALAASDQCGRRDLHAAGLCPARAEAAAWLSASAPRIAVWFVFAFLVRSFDWTLLGGSLLNIVVLVAICLALGALRQSPGCRDMLRWYDIALRAALVAALVRRRRAVEPFVGPTRPASSRCFPSMFIELHPDPACRASAARRPRGDRERIGA